jgi:hypothetical protein
LIWQKQIISAGTLLSSIFFLSFHLRHFNVVITFCKLFSRISQIHNYIKDDEEEEEESNPSESQDFLRDCAIHVQVCIHILKLNNFSLLPSHNQFIHFQFSFSQNTVQQIVSEFSDIDSLQNHDFGNSNQLFFFHFHFLYVILCYVNFILYCCSRCLCRVFEKGT